MSWALNWLILFRACHKYLHARDTHVPIPADPPFIMPLHFPFYVPTAQTCPNPLHGTWVGREGLCIISEVSLPCLTETISFPPFPPLCHLDRHRAVVPATSFHPSHLEWKGLCCQEGLYLSTLDGFSQCHGWYWSIPRLSGLFLLLHPIPASRGENTLPCLPFLWVLSAFPGLVIHPSMAIGGVGSHGRSLC